MDLLMRFIRIPGIVAAWIAAAALLGVQIATAHDGTSHSAPTATGFGQTELIGVIAVAIVILLVFRLTNGGDSSPESPDWQTGPVPPGTGSDNAPGKVRLVSRQASGYEH